MNCLCLNQEILLIIIKMKFFNYVQQLGIGFEDAVHTFEYFAAYIAVQALTLVPENIAIPNRIILFGGGWKNPVVKKVLKICLPEKG